MLRILLLILLFGMGSPMIDFEPHSGAVIPRGAEGEWDSAIVYAPHVVQQGDLYYLFYSGSDSDTGRPAAIGLATSTDGITWEKYAENPILAPDGDGYDAMCISVGVPMLLEDNTWVMYYAANSQPCYGPGRYIGRATAPAPEGPWTRDAEPVLTAGEETAWDVGYIMPHSIVPLDDGYLMYYSGGEEFLVPLPRLVGMAISSDGITWAKCDNPDNLTSPCAENQPINQINADETVSILEAWSVDIHRTEAGYGMFFSSTCPEMVSANCPSFLAYGVSEDGFNWQVFTEPDDRVLMPGCEDGFPCHRLSYPNAIMVEDEIYLYFTRCTEEENDCEIALATGTIEW